MGEISVVEMKEGYNGTVRKNLSTGVDRQHLGPSAGIPSRRTQLEHKACGE